MRFIRPGPKPAHKIPIWIGARGPRILRLVGRMGDGLFASYNYDRPENLAAANQRIDEGAAQAGRDPSEIRRGYNLMGVIELCSGEKSASDAEGKNLYGVTNYWVERILNWYTEFRQDTFIF
ncbi:MAG: LLM class flavin-dependent oxidoreductase [Chloroflexi bacterium]|nr:LLM class flavin-dependent oxidoreductase [Chloroflexota bacterium]